MAAATQKQPPQQSIMNRFDQQTYLGNQYAVAFSALSFTTTESPIYLLSCPTQQVQTASSNKEIGQPPVSLFFNMLKVTGVVATNSVILRAYYNPTVSNAGTTATNVINLRPSYALTGLQAVVTSAPTVSSDGTLLDVVAAGPFVSSQSGNLFIVDPGNTLLITAQASATSTASGLIGWYEL